MRKAFSLLFVLLMVICLSSCKVTPQVNTDSIKYEFTCKAQIKAKNGEYSCNISRTAPQTASMTILKPESLKGMTYNWNGTDFSMSCESITAEHKSCILPKDCFASVLVRAFDSCSQANRLKRKTSNEFIGTLDGDEFTITVDSESGYIQQINFPKYEVHATFEYSL